MKVMAAGLPGGTSFMEDYTYHLDPKGHAGAGRAHARGLPLDRGGKPSLEMHPLGIGGKADPVRLVFNAPAGPALNASMVDMGNRFRLIVNEVDVVAPGEPLPKLPVARALWIPQARPRDRRGGVDLRRWRPPHRLQPVGHHRHAGRFR